MHTESVIEEESGVCDTVINDQDIHHNEDSSSYMTQSHLTKQTINHYQSDYQTMSKPTNEQLLDKSPANQQLMTAENQMTTPNSSHTSQFQNTGQPSQLYNQQHNQNTQELPAENHFPEFDGDTSRRNPNFRPLLPLPKNYGKKNRQLIMDTETTGLDPNNGDRVIEVGIVEMVGRKFTGEKLHVYTNPMRGMDEEVIRVHGISEAFLTDMPTFDKVAKEVYDFMIGAEIIAHNAQFDMNFLNMEFAKVGLGDFASKVTVTDSLAIAKHKYPGQKNTLDALVRRLNVGKQDRTFHGALLDSEILAEVYLAMTGGQVSLAIDEESSDDGDGSHVDFHDLASLIIASNANSPAHDEWLMSVSDKFPAIKEVWLPHLLVDEPSND